MLFQVSRPPFFVHFSSFQCASFFCLLHLFCIIYLILWRKLNEQQSRGHTHTATLWARSMIQPTIQCVWYRHRCAFVWWRAFQTLLSPIHPSLILSPSIIHFIIILSLRAGWVCVCVCLSMCRFVCYMLVVYISWLFFYFFFFPPACCLSITFGGIVPTHHLINIVYNSVKVV